ncbi:hypothetical protein HQ45_07260 [Porphyromonas crevioricanis]|uniref:Lipoprotein n=2 Tax=Porphyromonas crevioricanis TaxID=393921 RepID=A0A0A2FEB0_9PORP|nr:hypothetical protein [Porphyromonas crevioricanis]KGN89328.1 hypothetical protein HQ45_07260 [Porphyromonas crevioricanis]GAD05840.1 hypothetical protein PORCRE_1549 [Porphyromonas crevioricanis JCM 15906]SKA02409.1 hypothetical protein SAMN02745203_01629 [Porphyromonas crevioricanis]SQH73112.1 Uncharacterised protein [Porphyromonas crevioricanis]
MKSICLLALIVLIGAGCNGRRQQSKLSNDKTAMTRVFDIRAFNRNKNDSNEYCFRQNDSVMVRQQETAESFYEFISKEGSEFEEVYEYYKTGHLKLSFLYFRYDFMTGVYREYDKQGKLIREEDLDKDFIFSWENIKQYLVAHGVKSMKNQVIGINRTSDDNPTWRLEFEGSYKEYNKGLFIITLDGTTGEEIEVKRLKGKNALGEMGTTANYEIIYSRKEE